MLAGVMSGSGSSFDGSSRATDPAALASLPTALLVGVKLPGVDDAEFDASLDELERLVKTLGYRVVGRVTQARASLAPTAVLGEGKLAELAALTGGTGDAGVVVPRKADKARARREAIAEGKTKVRPLKVYHGKVGRGLSVEMSVKHGPVTLLSVVQTRDGKLKLLAAEGESVPGPILEIGNTNSRYRFDIGAKAFLHEWSMSGPAHHCAIGIGHIADKIGKLAALIGVEVKQVC